MDEGGKMKGREESKGGEYFMGILVGKREGNCTPSPSWNFGFIKPDASLIQDSNFPTNRNPNLSARELGALLWEVQSQPKFGLANMSRYGPGFNHFPEQQMFPSRTAFTSNCSLNSNSEIGESSYTLKTSTDLLKVLNRIWSLEERHALDMSLVSMMKRELNESQARFKELLQGKRRDKDRQELDDASKRVAGNKVSRRNKEQARVKDLGKSVEVKLEDERKLRKYSENLCHKTVRGLSATKILLHDTLEELKLERKRRAMLEDLCDEFASSIREYEQQVRFLKQQSGVDQIGRNSDSGLILHVSEAWLDERMQMKLSGGSNGQKASVLDRLTSEIEILLGAKRSGCTTECVHVSSKRSSKSNIYRRSLESIHLNDPLNAPWNVNEEDDSDCVGVRFPQFNRVASFKIENGFEVETTSDDHPNETDRLKMTKKSIHSGKAVKGAFSRPKEFIKERKHRVGNKDSPKASTGNADETNSARIRRKTADMERASTSRKHSWASEIKKLQYEDDHMDDVFDPSTFTDPYSPVKKWISEATAAAPNISESPSSSHRTLKPNTLKAKLLEARLEPRRCRARASKDLSQVD